MKLSSTVIPHLPKPTADTTRRELQRYRAQIARLTDACNAAAEVLLDSTLDRETAHSRALAILVAAAEQVPAPGPIKDGRSKS
jgi:hypothetical protein